MRYLVTILFLVFYVSLTQAQWQLNGVPVCIEPDRQHISVSGLLSDGESGAFVVWGDNRDYWDIYAQRIDSAGQALWGGNGKAIAKAPGWQFAPRIVDDGSGGLVMVWNDSRNGKLSDVYAQRLDKNGNSLWAENGIPIIVEENDQLPCSLIRTADSCYIVCWDESKNFPPVGTINAQKFNNEGKILWDSSGIVINDGRWPELVSDIKGGFIAVWASYDGTLQMYAQRFDRNGNKMWGNDSIVVATDYCKYLDSNLSVCSDGKGGAIIAWDYWAVDDYGDTYVQRIDSCGQRLWGNTGIKLGQSGKQQISPRVSLLPEGNIIVIYEEYPYIYMNKLNLNGDLYYTNPGKRVNNYNSYIDKQIAVYKENIFIPIFNLTTLQPNKYKPYAHKIDTSGVVCWEYEGVKLSEFEFESNMRMHSGIVPDGEGGAIIAWDDGRDNYLSRDIYIQRVYKNGKVGGDTSTAIGFKEESIPGIFEMNVYPNPFNNRITLEFNIPLSNEHKIYIYDIRGRLINIIDSDQIETGQNRMYWKGKNMNGEEVNSGLYFISVSGREFSALRKVIFLK